MLRISIALALLAGLSACGKAGEQPAQPSPQASESASGVPCRVGKAGPMTPDCAIEREGSGEGAVLTIRHPDGGFRRLQLVKDGRGVVAADGAESAVVYLTGDGQAEIAIGDDLYRLPAVAVKMGR